ncbi:hypothetical protein VTO73DRAFT_15392 [Trametes versicolor]
MGGCRQPKRRNEFPNGTGIGGACAEGASGILYMHEKIDGSTRLPGPEGVVLAKPVCKLRAWMMGTRE